MMKKFKTTCIIPAYNEGPRIGQVLNEILPIKELDEVIVVNDGSTDDTLEQIQKFSENKKLKVISYDENKGLGHAIASGIEKAENDLIIKIDADMFGFTNEHFKKLIKTLVDEGNDFVLGSPFDNSSLIRTYQSYSLLLGFMVVGIFIFRKNNIEPVLEKIKESRYGMPVIIFNNFLKQNKKIKVIRLDGIRTLYKEEKEMGIKEKKKWEGILKGRYESMKMWLQIVKSEIEHPPIPSFEEFSKIIKKEIFKNNEDEVFNIIEQERKRQIYGLELIPSENYVSSEVLRALGSILTNKYSEGYPKKRYYGGNKNIDKVEILAQNRALELFKLDKKEWGVNVQPYSGSPANHAVYFALLNPGDTVMGLSLPSGGHLTHGWKVNFSAKYYRSVQYGVKPNGEFDYSEIEKLANKHKPKLIWTGATAHVRNFDYAKFAEIAEKTEAYLAADISHVAGLIAADVHNSPFPYADIVTTTTHKTLRGPRGAMIYAKQDLLEKINSAVFPGLQGGPHNHQTAAIAVALKEAMTPEFKEYGNQIVKNAKALGEALKKKGIKLAGGDPENHMMLLDFSDFGGGKQVESALELVGITVNKNTIPNDPNPPYYPSGVRIGTPAITSRGMREEEMEKIADWIARVLAEVRKYKLPENKEERSKLIKRMKDDLLINKKISKIRDEVRRFSSRYPVPGMTE